MSHELHGMLIYGTTSQILVTICEGPMYSDCCLLLSSENASLPFIVNPSLLLFSGNSRR
jgi:hypothetical protein